MAPAMARQEHRLCVAHTRPKRNEVVKDRPRGL